MVRKRLKRYFDYLDYKDMSDDPDNYFKNKKVINFNIIHNQCRGDPSQKSNKDHKTVSKDDFKNYPETDKNKVLSSVFRNNRDDLWIKRDLMTEHVKKNL